MTVSELMTLLEDCAPDAEVRIMSQPNWPFENAIAGVAVRGEMFDDECACTDGRTGQHEVDCPAADGLPEDPTGSDIFILEGAQERYGDREAWAAARR